RDIVFLKVLFITDGGLGLGAVGGGAGLLGLLGTGSGAGTLFHFFAAATAATATATGGTVAAAEELEAIDDDFVLAALAAAFLVVPSFVFETAFDEDRLALLAIFVDGLGHFSKGGTIDEEHLFAILALRRAPFVVVGQAEIDQGGLTGQIAQ